MNTKNFNPEVVFYNIDDLQKRSNTSGKNYADYESLNIQTIENTFWEKENVLLKRNNNKIISRWMICIQIGLCTAFVAGLFKTLFTYLMNSQCNFINNVFFYFDLQYSDYNLIIGLLIIRSIAGIMGGLVTFYIVPMAAGSGVPEVRAYLNGVEVPGIFDLKTLIFKIFGTFCLMLSGLQGSFEDIIPHLGAIIGVQLSTLLEYLSLNLGNYFNNEKDKQNMILTGIAAGAAAGFSSLISGVLFSFQLCASFSEHSIIFQSLVSACMGYMVVYAFRPLHEKFQTSQGILPKLKSQFMNIEIIDIVLYIAASFLISLIGTVYNWINLWIMRLHKMYSQIGWINMIEILAVVIITLYATYILYTIRPPCDIEESLIFCLGNSSNRDLMNYMGVSNYDIFIEVMQTEIGVYNLAPQILLFCYFFVCTSLCNHLYMPVGHFIYLTLQGALLGRLFAEFVNLYSAELLFLDPAIFSAVGMGAMLGATLRLSMGFCTTLFESLSVPVIFMFPVAISFLIGNVIARPLCKSFYDAKTERMPLLLNNLPPDEVAGLKADDIMNSPVKCLKIKENGAYIYKLLSTCKHNGFPVVDNVSNDNRSNGRLRGIVTRQQLILVLSNYELERNEIMWEVTPMDDTFRGRSVVPEFDLNKEINLFYIMNQMVHRVEPSNPVGNLYARFRGLSIRHLIVANNLNRVEGIITRKNFLENTRLRAAKSDIF